jgi:hypothetical protein
MVSITNWRRTSVDGGERRTADFKTATGESNATAISGAAGLT